MFGIKNNFRTFLAFLPDQRSALPARCIVKKPLEKFCILVYNIITPLRRVLTSLKNSPWVISF
jgi:hypothetical protein